MNLDEKSYKLLRAVIVLSAIGIGVMLVAMLLLYNAYETLNKTAGVRWFGIIALTICLVAIVVLVVIHATVRPRYIQQKRVRESIGRLLRLLSREVGSTKSFPGLDGAVIVVTKTEGDYLYDIEVRPAQGPASRWEVARYRINSKDNVRVPLPANEMHYVDEVYEAMRAPTQLRDEQAKRAAKLEPRRQGADIDSSDQSHLSSTHS